MPSEHDHLKTILAVDDDPLMLTVITGLLKADYRIKVATTGSKALEIVSRGDELDLVLLDSVLPDMAGQEVLRQLDANTPVIFLSGNSAECPLEALGENVRGWITKPFQGDALRAAVDSTLH